MPSSGSSNIMSRRTFVALSLSAGLGSASPRVTATEQPVIEANVEVVTEDGVCDAAFFHPRQGSHPGVLVWHDSLGLRPAIRELGKRIASEGYSALVPNLFYRAARAPVFDESFNYAQNPADREKYARTVSSFLSAGAAERDAVAYVRFLDANGWIDKKKKIGTHGYCLGGPYALRTAALLPERIGAAASFHGGFLVTDKPASPHLLAPKIKARLYFAIASDDDQREPDVKTKLKEAFSAAKGQAEIELFPNALHGWCVPDSKNAYNKSDADRAFAKLLSLYRTSL
jgi:carboxymethylenebutenolidase